MFSFLGKNIEPRLDAIAAFPKAKGAKDFFLRALRAFAVFLLIGKFLHLQLIDENLVFLRDAIAPFGQINRKACAQQALLL
jgi:hypothetical protein